MITAQQIQNTIVGEQYYRFPYTKITICCLTLRNGCHVIGESTFYEDVDDDRARNAARFEAICKIWPLEQYLAEQRLLEGNG